MTSEERLRWTAFIAASLLLHAAALAWLDLTGADIGRLPSKLTVLLESKGESEATEVTDPPASASRSRDLFDRPPVSVAKTAPVEPVEEKPATVEAAPPPEPVAVTKKKQPEPRVKAKTVAKAPEPRQTPAEEIQTASTPPPISAPEPAPLQKNFNEPTDGAASAAAVAAAKDEAVPDGYNAGTAQHQGQLLSLLHQAISKQKRYPLLAKRQRREGTTTVSFSLSPSGKMDAIGIDRSSGFTVLDSAAVSAVSRVAPFAPARLFLSDVTRFKVDVTFQLN